VVVDDAQPQYPGEGITGTTLPIRSENSRSEASRGGGPPRSKLKGQGCPATGAIASPKLQNLCLFTWNGTERGTNGMLPSEWWVCSGRHCNGPWARRVTEAAKRLLPEMSPRKLSLIRALSGACKSARKDVRVGSESKGPKYASPSATAAA